jgi:hypothetical protein
LIKRDRNIINTPPEIKIPEYPTCSMRSKPPNNEPSATLRGENIVSKTAAPWGKDEKILVINPDLEELDKKLPNWAIAIRIRTPRNPTRGAIEPITMDDIANTTPAAKIIFIALKLEMARIPNRDKGRKRIEDNEEYSNICVIPQPILLRNIKKKDW